MWVKGDSLKKETSMVLPLSNEEIYFSKKDLYKTRFMVGLPVTRGGRRGRGVVVRVPGLEISPGFCAENSIVL